ncbi:MAG: hypothetical protein ACYCU7_01130 [Acidimicrobiales bacterium]
MTAPRPTMSEQHDEAREPTEPPADELVAALGALLFAERPPTGVSDGEA